MTQSRICSNPLVTKGHCGKLARTPIILASVLWLIASLSVAQANDKHVRLEYTDENAPNEVIFGFFLRDVFKTSLSPHDGRYRNLLPGASNDTNLADVFDYLVLLWMEQDKEYGEAKMRMLCPVDGPRPKGKAIFAVFDSLDDVRHAIHHKYYAIAKSELIAKYSFELDAVLDDFGGFRQTWFWSEESYGGSIDDAEEVAAKICEGGHKTSFTTIHSEQE